MESDVRDRAGQEAELEPPLVVDVDGSLVATDLLWEGLVRVIVQRPHRIPWVLAGLFSGRATFKARVAETADLDLAHVPLRPGVRDLVRESRERGRQVVLASASPRSWVEAIARRVDADQVLVTEGETNLKGSVKLEAVRERFGTYEYVGDSAADVPLLEKARRAYLVDPDPISRWRAARAGVEPKVLPRSGLGRDAAWVRAIRPHQWVKNGLLVLPILAAHLAWSWSLVADVVAGLAAFSLLASAVYLVNDLADLPHDRRHATKRERPLASGHLSIPAALATAVGLVAASAVLALQLPQAFAAALGVYLVLNVGYSWGGKRLLVLDVVLLAALYTVRVVAGAALAEIELTGWFLAFAIFFFLSLAVLKRVVELEDRAKDGVVAGRSYRPVDLPVLRAVGPAAGVMSALVFCLYITGPVRELYEHPDLLWLGLPLFLYWIVRIWLLGVRGDVDDDAVVFVLRDVPSYAVLTAFLAVVFLAA